MEKEHKNILLLMMAGKGTRFNYDVPKQFYLIENRPIFSYIVEKLLKVKSITDVIILTNPMYFDYTNEWLNVQGKEKIYRVISGGNGRSQDILAGLEVAYEFAADDDNILIYDITHPFVDEEGIDKLVEAINKNSAATLAEYQHDTVYMINEDTNVVEKVIPRTKVIAGASPEGFKFKQIYNIFKNTPKEKLDTLTSAGAVALANNISMVAVETSEINLKITYQSDMKIVEKIFKAYFK